MHALGRALEVARAWGAERIAAVGTSAMREARNREVLVERAVTELGLSLTVIDGAREAVLSFRGARPGLAPLGPGTIVTVIDVGGGSTEIATGTEGQLTSFHSLDVGSVRLFERHLRSDPPTRHEIAALRADVLRALESAGALLEGHLVALAGTACTMAAIARGVVPFDARAVHGTSLTSDEVAEVAERLARSSIAERRRVGAIPPGREDVIAAGALLLWTLVEWAGARTLEVSDGGVRWGLALEMLGC